MAKFIGQQTIDASEPRLLRLSAAARYLGVSPSTVYHLVHRGDLLALSLPGLRGLRFDRADLESLIHRSKGAGPKPEAVGTR